MIVIRPPRRGSAYDAGLWDMFDSITSVWYGKQCYFPQDNGIVYSRYSGKYMPRDEAIQEFLNAIEET